MSVAQAKVPAVIASSLIFLILGAAGGSLATHVYGDPWEAKKPSIEAPTGGNHAPGTPGAGAQAGGPGGARGGRGGGPGGGGRGGPGGGRGGFAQPSARSQLATLVAKLDVLTEKPLAITLTPEQKKKVLDLLKDLETKKPLSDEDAKARMEALLELVKDQRATLEAAGYRWPGGRGTGGRPPTPTSNPFEVPDNAKHLKALRSRVSS